MHVHKHIWFAESRAITRYVAKKHKETGPDLLLLNNIKESAIVDTWMEVEAHQYDRPMREVIHQVLVNPIFGKPSSQEIIKNEIAKLEKVFDVYENRLSKFKYLAGEHYTMADLNHIPYLVYFMRTDYSNLITSRPNLSSWWSDISSRPASIKVIQGLNVRNN